MSQPEALHLEPAPEPMSGDYIIEDPQVAWDTTVQIPLDLDTVWAGRLGVSRMGMVGEENGAGFLFPARVDAVLPRKFRSLPPDAPMPRQLQVGDGIADGHKEDKAVVREITFDGPERTMVLEATWPARRRRKEDMHYSWQVTAKEDPENSGQTLLTARTRMEGVKNPARVEKYGPVADRFAMNLIRDGIMEGSTGAQPRKTRLGAAVLGGAAGGLAARELSRHSSRRSVRLAAPVVGAVLGAAAGARTARK